MHQCSICEERKPKDQFYKRSEGSGVYSHCKTCHKKKMRNRQDENKRKLVEALGGECTRCGYNKHYRILQFHHKNPSTKKFGIAKRLSYSFEYLWNEASKCELLCANCHNEEHLYDDDN